ncbi:UMP kinase [Candidatus Thioglobus sp.]|jgi:uridylate kinase|uniref:UMP kinase n=1 Tax=Candidatus Thioglobus sp. TaxID=2026721 RepID=UPI001770A13D|nr:UMP kinase [Candidatus Thioglobus sp.]HIL03513.1 UMP kinase [Candidatus Thioglobus autotrophicus]HIB28530.1 UMP kinase [Candidatus Thioglobus sp.]HIB30571.1 UMP kinase [Candidatus Thioglobus sp.]HIB98027.1 UMP kinase [Candidatus Thioglobus sp.]HIF47462.1 UMP kinase [Candidatus Thioglobus sp.]
MVKYKRILLKLSGEALASSNNTIDPSTLNKVVGIIKSVLDQGVELGIVVGGGNIFRGAALAEAGMNRVTGDHMGMLATVMNALAISDACRKNDVDVLVMSGFPIGGGVCEPMDHNKAKEALSAGKVVIFSAGTGAPCFTTDTGATLRAIEIGAEAVFKATKVDGVYTADPVKDSSATRYDTLSFDEAISKNLQIMDTSAFAMCREHNLEICVFSMLEDSNTLSNILKGEMLGTIVRN